MAIGGLVKTIRWRLDGRPVPPPEEHKRRVIRSYVNRSGAKAFVETGTWQGDTTAAIAPHVDQAFTIELDEELFLAAKRRFLEHGSVEVLWADSGRILGDLLDRAPAPAVVWLDGHYSGPGTGLGSLETPIVAELDHLLARPERGDVILIDDVRLFGEAPDYPTVDELRDRVLAAWPQASVTVLDDILRVERPSAE